MRRLDPLLLGAVALQWAVTGCVALFADHAGSVYGGREATEATVAAAERVVDGGLPATPGPGSPLLLAPVAWLTDSLGSVASVVTTVNVAFLAPLAAVSLVEIGRRTAGTLYAGVAVLMWTLAPVAAIPLFVSKYHDTYVQQVLPALYGLTVRPEYPAMALAIAAAALTLRAAAGARGAAALAGLLAGAATAMSPPAATVAVGIAGALVAARRRRGLLDAGAGLLLALMPTLLWRARVAGISMVTLADPSWTTFQGTMAQLREYFWSNRLLQWLPVAGAIGVLRLARPSGALLTAWLTAAAVVVVATSPGLEDGRLFIAMIPSWPAYALLVAAIPALVPTLVARLGSRLAPVTGAADLGMRSVGVAALCVAAVPLLAVAIVGR